MKRASDARARFAEVATFKADTVTRLAERASRTRGWNMDAAYVDLFLVPAGSEDAIAAGDEGSEAPALATRPLASIKALSAVGVRDGCCLLAVLSPPAPAAAPGERVARGSDLASALAAIQASSAALVAAVERSSSLARRAELERLLIPPRYSIASSPSSSHARGARSPQPDERFQLKLEVISFYGLWDPATASASDPAQRRVFTMLSPTAEPVALQDAVLAHIWPSAFAGVSAHLCQELGLPHAFHVHPRNFLILEKAVERAFDGDALLLLPARGVPPAPPTVRARVFRASATAAAAMQPLAGRDLRLPLAADGRVPFMRLLAWRAFSVLRADAEARDGDEELPSEVDVEATLSRDREGAVAGVGGFRALLSAGLIFGLGSRA